MSEKLVLTPQYVLLEDGKPVTVRMSNPESEDEPAILYAFSDKAPYDLFCAATKRELSPYPLVKGYLRRQIEEQPSTMLYMALDAISPDENQLDVATLPAILASLENRVSHVPTTVRDVLRKVSLTP